MLPSASTTCGGNLFHFHSSEYLVYQHEEFDFWPRGRGIAPNTNTNFIILYSGLLPRMGDGFLKGLQAGCANQSLRMTIGSSRWAHWLSIFPSLGIKGRKWQTPIVTKNIKGHVSWVMGWQEASEDGWRSLFFVTDSNGPGWRGPTHHIDYVVWDISEKK